MLYVFKKRISVLQSAYKKTRKTRGTVHQSKGYFNTLKNSSYKVNIHYTEIEVMDFSKKNEKLQNDKR